MYRPGRWFVHVDSMVEAASDEQRTMEQAAQESAYATLQDIVPVRVLAS